MRQPADAVNREDDGRADGAAIRRESEGARRECDERCSRAAGERIDEEEDDREPAVQGSERAVVKPPREELRNQISTVPNAVMARAPASAARDPNPAGEWFIAAPGGTAGPLASGAHAPRPGRARDRTHPAPRSRALRRASERECGEESGRAGPARPRAKGACASSRGRGGCSGGTAGPPPERERSRRCASQGS